MADLFVVAILAVIVGAAIVYIIKEKKRGVKCIGCPAARNCAGKNHGDSGCSCGCQSEQ